MEDYNPLDSGGMLDQLLDRMTQAQKLAIAQIAINKINTSTQLIKIEPLQQFDELIAKAIELLSKFSEDRLADTAFEILWSELYETY